MLLMSFLLQLSLFHLCRQVRCAACRALGALRVPEALPGLAQAFEDACAPVRPGS